MGAVFNGATGLFPFTGRLEEKEDDVDTRRYQQSRPVDQQALLLLILLAPTDFRIESRTPSTAHLVWNTSGTGVTFIEIERALGDGSFAFIDRVAFQIAKFTDTGLAIGTRYRYRLRIV